MARSSHTQTHSKLPFTDSFKYLGMVRVRYINLNSVADAALRPFTAGTLCIKEFLREHNLTNRSHVYMWLLKTFTNPADVYASQFRANPSLRQGKEMGQSYTSMAADGADEDYDGQGHNPFMERHARV